MLWAAYIKKYGSLSFGRRLEQSFGKWMGLYTRFKVGGSIEVDDFDFMPHEDGPVLSFEEQRMKEIQRQRQAS